MSDEIKVGNHAMLDIETLSTDNNAFIMQIAIKMFDPLQLTKQPEPLDLKDFNSIEHMTLSMGIDDSPAMNIHLYPWMEQVGSHVDGKTVQWWQQQSWKVKKWLYQPSEMTKLVDALEDLDGFLTEHNVDYVWSRSPSFDITIVNNAAKRELGKILIPFWKERDQRTLHALWETLTGKKYKLDNSHDALADCDNQIKVVQLFYKELYERNTGTI